MRTFNLKFSFLLPIFLVSFFTNSFATDFTCANPKSFDKAFSTNTYSKLILIGNTSLCSDSNSDGVCEDPGTATNNSINMIYNDYDNINGTSDSNSTLLNSSAAYLDMPAGKTVLWAGLFWQGYMVDWTDPKKETGHTIKYKHESDSYQTELNAEMNWVYFSSTRFYYQSFIEITDYVNTNGPGYYWVGDIATTEGQPVGGSFGGWSIAVVYEDENEDIRNITLYHGYQGFAGSTDINNAEAYALANGCSTDTGVGNNVLSTLTGFLTPKSGTVNSTLTVFAGEGDIGLSGDSGSITDKSGAEHALTNTLNPATNIMNATISRDGATVTTGLPYYAPNSLGIDIDTYDLAGILNNEQSTTDIKFNTSGDGYMPGMYALQSDLRKPQLCYDYAYSQNGEDFTVYYATGNPRIIGTNISTEPIDMKLYIRNEENSDIKAEHMVIDILDINDSQAKYISGSTQVTYPSAYITTDIPEAVIDSSDSYIKNIPIGEVNGLEYFYTYYQLDPSVSDINISINAKVDYNISLDIGQAELLTIPYSFYLNSSIPMCSGGAANYNIIEGMFNIVHENYADASLSSGYRYNLPTQVTSRPGNFRLISLDPENVNTLQDINSTVAIQLMNISGFSTPEAICEEDSNAIGERVWVTISGDNNHPFTEQDIINGVLIDDPDAGKKFYQNATRNAAFRIYYPVGENNATNLTEEIPPIPSGRYKLINFTVLAGTPCAYPVTTTVYNNDGTPKPQPKTFTQVPEACGSSGDGDGTGMTQRELNACMECIFGNTMDHFCSRDNFSIRPEAFLMNIDDQNQTTPTTQVRLTTNYSGVNGATAPTLNLASGYDYNIEVNATNHTNNSASPGYTQSLSVGANYIWEPRSFSAASATINCNDDDNKSSSINFNDGVVNQDSNVSEVGEYRLNILDTTWTEADSDTAQLGHHTGTYFQAGTDCATGSNVQITTSNSLNGCDISSNHTNNDTNLTYNDFNVTFHPYKFDVSTITPTVGLNHTDVNSSSYIYMADMSFNNNQDQNMSYHLNGFILPQGYNESNLSNFVDGCFAKALDINVSINGDTALTDTLGNQIVYQSKFHDINSTTDSEITALTLDANYTTPVSFIQISTGQNYFKKDFDGSMETRLNLNYHRDLNVSVNPKEISFMNYDVDCNDSANNCTFKADMIQNKTTQGTKDLNSSIAIKHYYGRTHAPRNRFVGPTGNAFIYYEVFCNGVGCDKTLLQNGHNSRVTDDPRWFRNEAHVVASHGSAGAADGSDITQKNAANVTTGTLDNNTTLGQTTAPLTYNENRGYPYKATMENNASGFLIYNKYDTTNTSRTNEFEVEFVNTDGNWAGKADSSATTREIGSKKTNRRSMW